MPNPSSSADHFAPSSDPHSSLRHRNIHRNNKNNHNTTTNKIINKKKQKKEKLQQNKKFYKNNKNNNGNNNNNNNDYNKMRSANMNKREALDYFENNSDSLPMLNDNHNDDSNINKFNNNNNEEILTQNNNNSENQNNNNSKNHYNFESDYKSKERSGIKKDIPGMLLLILLYIIQGVPTGLTFGSIPFLLQERASYTQIGIFSLSQYPYSLKLLWSPIVDAIYVKKFGRRKSWIVPIQITAGLILLYLSYNIDSLLFEQPINVFPLTAVFFILTLLMATQDIAVDGWAITILSKENIGYASTCQNVGLSCGFFLSFTILLAFSSLDFTQRLCGAIGIQRDVPLMTLDSYLWFWGIVYLVATAFLVSVVREKGKGDNDDDDFEEETPNRPKEIYSQMIKILKLPQMRSLLFVLLFCRVGFSVADNATQLKLRERGLTRETLAMVVTVAFPFEFIFAVLAGKWSRGRNPLQPWYFGFKFRLVMAAIIPLAVYLFHADNLSNPFLKVLLYGLVLCLTLMYSLASNFMFVSMGAFYALISDSAIGGTYMTFLNTFGNFGGTWPRFFVMLAIDKFDNKECRPCREDECLDNDQSEVCQRVGVDGYYVVAALCVLLGIGLMKLMKKQIDVLQATKPVQWKVSSHNTDDHKK